VFLACYLYLDAKKFGIERSSEPQDPELNLGAMMVAFSVALGVTPFLR
jgi:hypothetical protein